MCAVVVATKPNASTTGVTAPVSTDSYKMKIVVADLIVKIYRNAGCRRIVRVVPRRGTENCHVRALQSIQRNSNGVLRVCRVR